MEQWRKILMSQVDSDEVGILDDDVTGIKGIHDAPDGVFYSEFTEEDAQAYMQIFVRFNELYSINSRIAISALEDDLIEQTKASADKFNPVELILYSSRYSEKIISTDIKVFKKIRAIIVKLLDNDAVKTAEYILGGWEWKTQLAIFVEAVGIATPELVDLAMKYYPQIANLCSDDDKMLLKSFVNMLLSTQDESFAEYFSDVASNREFMNNNEAIDYFCNAIKRDPYWRNEAVARQLLDELDGRNLNFVFRRRIEELRRQLLKTDYGKESTIHGVLNSRNVDYETKMKWAEKLQFSNCTGDLYEWEMIRDPDGCILADRQGMTYIEKIYPDEYRGRAYVALSTHGKYHKDEVIKFLIEQRNMYPEYSFPIDIALFELKMVSAEELFSALYSIDYKPFYGKNIGKYFRYNKMAFSNDYMVYTSKVLRNSDNETELANNTQILLQVLKEFNGRDGKLADEALGLPEKIMLAIKGLNYKYQYANTYDSLLDLFDLLASVNPSSKNDILDILDNIKIMISSRNDMSSIEFRINSTIRKMDTIVAPQ